MADFDDFASAEPAAAPPPALDATASFEFGARPGDATVLLPRLAGARRAAAPKRCAAAAAALSAPPAAASGGVRCRVRRRVLTPHLVPPFRRRPAGAPFGPRHAPGGVRAAA